MSSTDTMHLGEELDDAGARNGARIDIDPAHLTTHGVILGMTGSGKTGLGIVLLEEALAQGIPALIIDPKGDMGNLLLNFPALRGEDFRPWIDEAEAARAKVTADDYAAQTSAKWTKGLADWDVSPDAMRRLGLGTRFTIFTPGSMAGVPINVVGSLQAPQLADAAGMQGEAVADQIESFVSGLLALIERTSDPLSSPDHILLSNLIARAWSAGQSLDLGALIGQVANPPIRKLGVFELDTFMPPKERMALAVRLNALLASPSFAAWQQGVPLDMQQLLWDAGKPRAAIVYLAHLSDAERQFIVTLLMSRMVAWMRQQPGTSELRALIYMDEVAGFAPPSAEPPSKKPMLTILKQARAHGVGMVLSTQNPVDLDYKAMSNAGTWLIGRLQTERDKARVLEGMRSAAGEVDIDALNAMIGGLTARQFLLHSARGGAPRRFTTRWAMSYLRGPLTRIEIERLMADDPARAVNAGPAANAAAATAAHAADAHATATHASPETRTAAHAAAAQTTARGGADSVHESVVAPATAANVRVCYLDPAATWAADIGAVPGAQRHEAAVAARVHLRYDDAAAGIDMSETYECVWHPLTDPARPADAHLVDYDERDLRAEAPAGIRYTLSDAPIDQATYFRSIEKQLRAHLLRNRATEVLVNRELKLFSRAGESREEFSARCRAAAAERADAEAAKLRDRYATKRDRLEKQQRAAEDRVRELNVDAKQRVQQEIIAGAGQLLSVFLGGRGSARSLAGAASRRGTTRRTQERLDTAEGRAADVAEALREVEEELTDDMARITDRWDAIATHVESKRVGLEAGDIAVEEVVLVWVPVE